MIEIKHEDLDNAVRIFRAAPKEQKAGIRKGLKQYEGFLKQYLRARARGDVQKQLAASATFTARKDGMTVVVGSKGKRGSSPGIALGWLVRPYEFGGNPQKYETYLSRRGSRGFEVDRRTQTQIPTRSRTGWFVYPAIAEATPDLVSLWMYYLTKTFREQGW